MLTLGIGALFHIDHVFLLTKSDLVLFDPSWKDVSFERELSLLEGIGAKVLEKRVIDGSCVCEFSYKKVVYVATLIPRAFSLEDLTTVQPDIIHGPHLLFHDEEPDKSFLAMKDRIVQEAKSGTKFYSFSDDVACKESLWVKP